MPDHGHELIFGTFTVPSVRDAAELVRTAQISEAAGLELHSFQDHPYNPGFLDTWTALSWVASQTSTLRLHGNVLNLPLRAPAMLARAAASLDLLSCGRFELGVGGGGFTDAIAGMGGPRRSGGESVAPLSEAAGADLSDLEPVQRRHKPDDLTASVDLVPARLVRRRGPGDLHLPRRGTDTPALDTELHEPLALGGLRTMPRALLHTPTR